MRFSRRSALIAGGAVGACLALVVGVSLAVNAGRPSAAASVATPGTSPSSATPGTPTPSATSSAASSAATRSAATTTRATATSAGGATVNPASSTTPPTLSGWRADWTDTFDVAIDSTRWGRYGWGNQVPGQGAMGRYLQSNTFTSGGKLVLRTQYAGGEWSSAGVSSGDFYSAAGGRWEVRAKFPASKGIGYVFLLYPADGTWPPEVDFAEGRVNGPQVMGTYHWGADNSQDHRFLTNTDMHGWHTYGVIIGTDRITYTFDGKPWAVAINGSVTTKKLWIGFQCGAMDPNGSAKQYETVDGGVPGPLTPAVSDIQIDWVAHYVPA